MLVSRKWHTYKHLVKQSLLFLCHACTHKFLFVYHRGTSDVMVNPKIQIKAAVHLCNRRNLQIAERQIRILDLCFLGGTDCPRWQVHQARRRLRLCHQGLGPCGFGSESQAQADIHRSCRSGRGNQNLKPCQVPWRLEDSLSMPR